MFGRIKPLLRGFFLLSASPRAQEDRTRACYPPIIDIMARLPRTMDRRWQDMVMALWSSAPQGKPEPTALVREALSSVRASAQRQLEQAVVPDDVAALAPILPAQARTKLGAIFVSLEAPETLWDHPTLSPEDIVLQAATQKTKISY